MGRPSGDFLVQLLQLQAFGSIFRSGKFFGAGFFLGTDRLISSWILRGGSLDAWLGLTISAGFEVDRFALSEASRKEAFTSPESFPAPEVGSDVVAVSDFEDFAKSGTERGLASLLE